MYVFIMLFPLYYHLLLTGRAGSPRVGEMILFLIPLHLR